MFSEVNEVSETDGGIEESNEMDQAFDEIVDNREEEKKTEEAESDISRCPKTGGKWEGERGNSRWLKLFFCLPVSGNRSMVLPYKSIRSIRWEHKICFYNIGAA